MDPIQLGFSLAVVAVAILPHADPEVRADASTLRWSRALVVLAVAATLEPLRGPIGAVLAGLYLIGVLGLAWRALVRATGRSAVPASERGLVLAHAFLVGGGVWLWAHAARVELLGFGDPWALLTAAHFHAAGFGALAFSALVLRATERGAWLLGVHVVAFALVAAGLNGVPVADRLGVVLYALLFATQLVLVARARLPLAVRAAAALPLATTALAADWAFGGGHLGLAAMAWTHGVGNALGHVALGLAGLARADLRPSRPRLRAPISCLRAGLRVGGDFLSGLQPENPERPEGISDDFGAYARADFDVDRVDPEIRRFYERTSAYELEAVPDWKRGFRLGGRAWSALAAWVGQLGLPAPGRGPADMDSRILDVDDAVDGRSNVRGWVRRWRHSGRPVYVATYAEHCDDDGRRYMNIAFPLPGSNLTSILHLAGDGAGGVILTSLGTGDQGVYLGLGGRPLRLPLDETIHVRPGDAAETLTATHAMWLAGVPYLTLSYRIWRR